LSLDLLVQILMQRNLFAAGEAESVLQSRQTVPELMLAKYSIRSFQTLCRSGFLTAFVLRIMVLDQAGALTTILIYAKTYSAQ
jgi:hypothetical protein